MDTWFATDRKQTWWFRIRKSLHPRQTWLSIPATISITFNTQRIILKWKLQARCVSGHRRRVKTVTSSAASLSSCHSLHPELFLHGVTWIKGPWQQHLHCHCEATHQSADCELQWWGDRPGPARANRGVFLISLLTQRPYHTSHTQSISSRVWLVQFVNSHNLVWTRAFDDQQTNQFNLRF